MTTPILPVCKVNKNMIYIKREDFFPFSFGGNKARKATYFLKEIDAGNYDCVVTYGSSSSNHCRIISNMAVARNLPCYIIAPKEASKETYNSKMMKYFGAEITIVPIKKVGTTINAKLEKLRNDGKQPYFIQGGGHGNLGTQAYVDCYEEIKDFEAKDNIFFDYIFLASGTGTTQAGLVCGQLLNHDKRKIIGISIARKNPRGRNIVLNSIEDYLGYREDIESNTFFIDDYTGDGYGAANDCIKATIKEVLVNYGIPLDLTYTGKAYYGMKNYIEKNKISGHNILFIHTGGTPLFFDDFDKLQDSIT